MTSIHESYQEKGYYHARGVYSAQELIALEADFDRIVQQLTDSGEDINARWGGEATAKLAPKDSVVVHTHNVQKYSAAWLRAFLHPKFVEVSQAILGPDVVLHHSKLFQKPAEKGAPFPMHQDWSYFPSVKDTMMAGIIHVSAATDAMGCLRVVPGSHQLGRIPRSDGVSDPTLADRFPIADAIPIEAEPGDVVFFHYCTLHGSQPNLSDRTRKTVLVQMLSGQDVIEDGVKHPNERLVISGFNSNMNRSTANHTT